MKDELLQVAPSVLLRTDKTEYYRDCDIPCLCVKEEYGMKETYMIGEERSTRIYGNKVVSLVTNTIPVCLRYEPYVLNNTILVVTHCKDNSWFKWKNPREGHDYDTRCKKIARGIAAYIGRYCWIDEAGELDWASGTIEDIYRTYHDEATRLIKLMSRDYDRAYRHKDIQTMQRVGNEIEAQHIQQEAAYIEQSSRVGELLGEPVLEAAKGYITWLQGRDKPQPSQDDAEPQIPQELTSDEAKAYFKKAIKLGLMDDKYQWKKGLQMLSCFAREMSLHLKLNNAQNSDGSYRVSWKPFEILFNVQDGKLRLNYADIQKIGQEPSEAHLIDDVFR